MKIDGQYGTFYEKLPPQPNRRPTTVYGKDGYDTPDPVLVDSWDEQRAEWLHNDGATRCAACKHEQWVHDGPRVDHGIEDDVFVTFCRWSSCYCGEYVLTEFDADLALVALMV